MLIGAQLFLSLVVGLSVWALVTAIRSFVASEGAGDRLQEFLQTGMGPPPTLRQLEMHASFYERAVKPTGTALLRLLGRLAPQRNVVELQRKLDSAGNPGDLSVMDLLGIKIVSGLILGVLIVLVMRLFRGDISLLIAGGFGLLAGLLGFGTPNYWLSSQISKRQSEILKALPDALDMLTICVRAGLGLSGAMQKVCENWDNALADEFARVLTETRLGRSRAEALETMAKRTGVDEVLSFVMALTMAEKMGANISQVLTVQAKQMRIARRQRAEKLAREASIKMLFPLVFLVFPAMFAVILGPAVPILIETFTSL
jgi:tight adherence protein C